MAEQENKARDEVLSAFHSECERPSAADILRWVQKYPQFADDIREHAALSRDMDDAKAATPSADDQAFFARARSHALNALHEARKRASEASAIATSSFDALMSAERTDIPRLAKELNISRGVLAAMMGGRMKAPVGTRLVKEIRRVLNISIDQFDAAFRLALESPQMGHAKATSAATVHRQSYEEIIQDASMSDEQKTYWLSE